MAGLKDVARRAGVDDELASRLVDAMGDILSEGETIRIRGLGSFFPVKRPERTYRTPVMKGGVVKKPAHTSVRFRPSSMLVQRLNPNMDVFHEPEE